VLHVSNPNYLGSRDGEDCSLRPAQAKELARPHLKQQARVMALHIIPAEKGGIGRRIKI
jgi:hypothetical protein